MTIWTINGRFAAQPVTGVQRYAREIVCALDRLLPDAPDISIELAVPPATTLPFTLKNIAVRAVGSRHGHLWEQIDLPQHGPAGLLSLANTGPIAHRRHIVCIHDANTRVCPESYSLPFRALYRGLHPLLGRSARRVATVSQHAAGDLVRFGIVVANKVFVAPNGHEHALRWQPRHTDATRAAAGPDTIVVLGSPAPHKNIALLLDLAPQLAENGLSLAIVGLADGGVFARTRTASAAVTHPNVHWLGRISDDALAALLADSLCLAFPSLTEGFGLPPLEAMARGCPVVVSDRASLPEICGSDALYAAPDSPDQWLAHFRALHAQPQVRAAQIARGQAQAQHFSWTRSAALYLGEMRTLG
jgi:glycosyltransferase involved in cell wall biosynthesis